MLLPYSTFLRGRNPLGRSLGTMTPELRRVPPPFEQIADYYAAEIRSGRLATGDYIPANAAIVSTWSVSKATASKATDRLRSLGLVETVPGHGLRVLPQ